MSRPCVCAGNNENCRYCGGQGEINDRLAGALLSHSKQQSRLTEEGKTEAERRMEIDALVRNFERRSL